MPTATLSQATVKNANEANGKMAASDSPTAAIRTVDASPGSCDARYFSALARPRKRLDTPAKMPASDNGRISASRRSLGLTANATPRIMGVMLTSKASFAARLA